MYGAYSEGGTRTVNPAYDPDDPPPVQLFSADPGNGQTGVPWISVDPAGNCYIYGQLAFQASASAAWVAVPGGSLTNGWNIPIGGYFQYRVFTATNTMQLAILLGAPASGTVNGVTIFTFPAGAVPVTNRGFPVGAGVANNSAGNASPFLVIASTGVMTANGIGNSALVYAQLTVPLAIGGGL